MSRQPLEGVRVIDFSLVVAGPYASMLLGWLGAEVIKIESARRPRFTGLPDTLNCTKMSCTLNLTSPEGVQLARELIQCSDVVVENFSPRTMKRFGLDYPETSQIKPDLIMVSMSGFGQTGPDHDYVGLAPGFVATTGGMHLTGFPEEMPLLPGTVSTNDLQSGLFSAFAVMSALHHRSKTGEGQYVDLSQAEVAASFIAEGLLEHFMTGNSPVRRGNRDISMAPHGNYRCKGDDKWVSIAVANDSEWQSLCTAAGHPEWALDDRFVNAVNRWKNQDELDQLLQTWTINYSHYEVMKLLQEAGIAAGPSLDAEELLDDPHLRERGAFITTTQPGSEPRIMQGLPWESNRVTPPYRRAPLPGENNSYVFGELLGLPKTQIQNLEEAKIIH